MAVSVGIGVLEGTRLLVWVSVGVSVAVHVSEGVAVGRAGKSGRATAPVMINETQAIDIKTSTKDIPKKRQPADLCRLRSGQLALLRLTCMEWMPAQKLKKAPSKPSKMAIMRPVRIPMLVIIAYGPFPPNTPNFLPYSGGARK